MKKAFALKMKRARAAAHRRKNPGRVHTKKFDRCVRKVKRRASGRTRNAYAVCSATLGKRAIVKRHRRRNIRRAATRFFILAVKGKESLYYNGTHFSSKRDVRYYVSKEVAKSTAKHLLRTYPVLRTYDVYVGRT